MALTSLARYRGPLRPHLSPRRAAHRPASLSPPAAHCACVRLRCRYLRLMSKVRCRWGYALQCLLCTKLLGWCGWVRKIKSPLAPLSLAPLRSLAEASGAADPLQPKSHTLWKTCASRNTFSRTPLPATTLATSDVAPVTLVPSVVRTLRLSLLHSQLPWVASHRHGGEVLQALRSQRERVDLPTRLAARPLHAAAVNHAAVHRGKLPSRRDNTPSTPAWPALLPSGE